LLQNIIIELVVSLRFSGSPCKFLLLLTANYHHHVPHQQNNVCLTIMGTFAVNFSCDAAAMPVIVPINGVSPQIPAFLAANATLVGDVRFGEQCSVWFGAVLRADIHAVILGARCNVQDLCVLHVSRRLPCVLHDDVSMGHGAIAHACTVGAGSLLGMGSRILDGAVLGRGVLVAAGCVVPEGMAVPDHHLIAGVPGRVIKPLGTEIQERIGRIAGDYVAYQALYPSIMNEVEKA
jgi:carbonic anhydrase/acetyltransferase-like protein (isoleucine patch superfamily)